MRAGLPLPAALAGVATGILAADHGVGLPVGVCLAMGLAVATAGVALRGVTRGAELAAIGGVMLVCVGVGTWRHAGALPEASAQRPSAAALAGTGERHLVGTVVGDPRPRGDRLQLLLGDIVAENEPAALNLADRMVVWLPRGVKASDGDRLRITARLEVPQDFDGFAYREFLERQGVSAIARTESVEVVAGTDGPAAWLPALRTLLLDGLNRVVPEPEAALGAGILLGVRAAIAPEINEAFETAGLTHVVAISGWNIAIVAALVTVATRPLERRPGGRWTPAMVAAATVGGYVVLTGATPSVVRAALMAGAMLVARLGGSRAHAASALALAAFVMLLAAPMVLWDVGFQLSLLATGGLIWFGAPIERRLASWPTLVREPVALTLAAQLTTLPVMLVNFERLSLVAPLANVLVVPLVPAAMVLSAVAALAGVLTELAPVPHVADAVTWLTGGSAWLVLRAMIALGTALASLPHAAVDVTVPPLVAVAWLPMLALFSWALGDAASGESGRPPEPAPQQPRALETMARRVVRPIPMGLAVVSALAVISIGSLPDGRLHITVLDVGQGDAILVEAPDGATMLVDGGPDPELTLRRLGANLPFFARRIDVVVVSHPHQDHVAGLVEVTERFDVGLLLHAGIGFENQAYDSLLVAADAERVPVALARTGQAIRLGESTTAEVLYPTERDAAMPLPAGDINNASVVLLVRHLAFSALLTGDAEAPIETLLLDRDLIGPVDLLKVGHHGSTSSTTDPFVGALDPSVAVISAAADNDYGHPAPDTLATLADHGGITVYRTDLHGDVEVVTDGRSFFVHTRDGTAPPRQGESQRWRGEQRTAATGILEGLVLKETGHVTSTAVCRTEPSRARASPCSRRAPERR